MPYAELQRVPVPKAMAAYDVVTFETSLSQVAMQSAASAIHAHDEGDALLLGLGRRNLVLVPYHAARS